MATAKAEKYREEVGAYVVESYGHGFRVLGPDGAEVCQVKRPPNEMVAGTLERARWIAAQFTCRHSDLVDEKADPIRREAREEYADAGRIDVDPDARVLEIDDPTCDQGYWVEAWVWVAKDME